MKRVIAELLIGATTLAICMVFLLLCWAVCVRA